MSRERPPPAPRVDPSAPASQTDYNPYSERQRRQAAERERARAISGPGAFGALDALLTTRRRSPPQFVRRGYEASIVENLNDQMRGRGWRMRHCRAGATWKERQKARRQAQAK